MELGRLPEAKPDGKPGTCLEGYRDWSKKGKQMLGRLPEAKPDGKPGACLVGFRDQLGRKPEACA